MPDGRQCVCVCVCAEEQLHNPRVNTECYKWDCLPALSALSLKDQIVIHNKHFSKSYRWIPACFDDMILCSSELSCIQMELNRISANAFSHRATASLSSHSLGQEVCPASWWENQISSLNVWAALRLFVCFLTNYWELWLQHRTFGDKPPPFV